MRREERRNRTHNMCGLELRKSVQAIIQGGSDESE